MTEWLQHARFEGPIVMIGFGSIGRGTLPLLERHLGFDKAKFTVIAPDDADRALLDERGIAFQHLGLTRENYIDVLKPLLTAGGARGLVVNLSVRRLVGRHRAGSARRSARSTSTRWWEPWPGFYTDTRLTASQRSNYALRESMLDLRPGASGRPDGGDDLRGQIRAWCPGWSSRHWSIWPRPAVSRSTRRHPARAGRRSPGRSASRASISRSAIRSAPSRRSRWASSSTHGRSKASCRRGCSLRNSAGAPTRRLCRPTAAATISGRIAPSTCCAPVPVRASAPGRRRPARSTASS